MELRSVHSVEEARKHLERLCRALVPSSTPCSTVQRACMRELLALGLQQEAPGRYVQHSVLQVTLGPPLLQVRAGVGAGIKQGGAGRAERCDCCSGCIQGCSDTPRLSLVPHELRALPVEGNQGSPKLGGPRCLGGRQSASCLSQSTACSPQATGSERLAPLPSPPPLPSPAPPGAAGGTRLQGGGGRI